MVASISSIPCQSHRDCLSHRPCFPESHTSKAYARIQDLKVPCKPGNDKLASEQQTWVDFKAPIVTVVGRSQIELLPRELFFLVLQDLDPPEKASLALTSRSMAYAMGPDIWDATREWNRTEANHFLRILVRDISEKYWHCEECMVLHRRSFAAAAQCSTFFRRFSVLNTLLRPQERHLDERQFHVRIQGAPLYTLSFPLIKAVMDRHLQSPHTGKCIDTLGCSGMRKFPYPSKVQKTILKYEFRPKIILDRILLKATYTWELENWRDILANPSKLRPKDEEDHIQPESLIKNVDLWVCEHMNAIAMLRDAAQRPLTRLELRCQYCPTQFWVTFTTGHLMKYYVEFQVWHNLGPCREPEEQRWTHFVSRGVEKKEYEWQKWSRTMQDCADEDIWESYEWILYSSRKEFERKEGKFGQHRWDRQFYPDAHSKDAFRRNKRLARSVAETL